MNKNNGGLSSSLGAAARALALVLIALSLFACKSTQQKTTAAPLSFADAVRTAANSLMNQVKKQEGVTGMAVGIATGKTVFMLDPVVDANTAEVNQASLAVEKILREEAAKVSDRYVFVPLTLENYDGAKYVVSGAMLYSAFTDGEKAGKDKMYKLALAVIERKSGKVVASSDAWISDKKIDVTPVAAYQDSPMYLKDKRVEGQIETAQMSPGQQADPNYFDSLPTASLLTEADAAYEAEKLEQALGMYKAASLRPDGQIMKTYAGLYQTNRRLRKFSEAEVAFGQLVNIGYQNNNISTKLFFGVASTDFINDAELRAQYAIWLRQIAKLFARSSGCLIIAGHSSHSGSANFNEQLSLQRATAVQKIMQKDFPQIQQRSKPIGYGWKENIIGSGTDDLQDAIDRRVEFKISECGKL
ncbi:OmpA family protein [Uliginosibacterium sp. H3]|uniref:OmpA family protein n=1 Tax=Uliginosibacterium silvisoli TaxID=3114758 RepID=A0ABU6K9I9_9RHOO|nr:OmpA family protein [Uliginosibacterium sp. H3]